MVGPYVWVGLRQDGVDTSANFDWQHLIRVFRHTIRDEDGEPTTAATGSEPGPTCAIPGTGRGGKMRGHQRGWARDSAWPRRSTTEGACSVPLPADSDRDPRRSRPGDEMPQSSHWADGGRSLSLSRI